MKNRRERLKSKVFKSNHIDNHWAISYGDMITLLLGFFVLFFNIKTETVNIKLIQKNLLKKFSTDTNTSRTEGPRIVDKKENSIPKIPIASEKIKNDLKISTNLQGEKLLIEFPEITFFESGRYDLTTEGKKALSDFASTVSADLGNVRFIVRGYTDNSKLKSAIGRAKDNLELSAFRSLSAIRYLNKEGEIPLNLMRIAGFAEASPIDRKMSSEDQKKDRKISIVIEPLDANEKITGPQKTKNAKKVIEDQKSFSLHGETKRIPATIESLKNLANKIRTLSFHELAPSQIYQSSQDIAFKTSNWVGEQDWYKSYLEFLISIDYRFKKIEKKQEDKK